MKDILVLILNLFIVIKPVFIYQLAWFRFERGPGSRPHFWLMLICSVVSLVLSLVFPFQLVPGVPLDFRIVPLVLGCAYGGPVVSAFLLAIVGMRAALSHTAAEWLLFGCTALLLAGYGVLLKKKEDHGRAALRGGAAVSLVYAGGSAAVEAADFVGRPDAGLLAMGLYLALSVVATTVSLYLMSCSEQALRAKRYAAQTEKLQALGRMAVTVVHEMRNPLTAVTGFLRLLQREGELDEGKREHYFTVLNAEMKAMNETLQLYFRIAQPADECLQPVELDAVVQAAVHELEGVAAEKNVCLECCSGKGIQVMANRDVLHGCLGQLLLHAMDAMPTGGRLDIRLADKGRHAELRIVDTGAGLSEEALRQLGTPHYSTRTDGTGLPLLLAYRYIESLGGQLLAERHPGGGTERLLRIPIAQPVRGTG